MAIHSIKSCKISHFKKFINSLKIYQKKQKKFTKLPNLNSKKLKFTQIFSQKKEKNSQKRTKMKKLVLAAILGLGVFGMLGVASLNAAENLSKEQFVQFVVDCLGNENKFLSKTCK